MDMMGQGGLLALAVVAVMGFGLGSCATASNALNLTLLTDGVDELGARCLDGSPGEDPLLMRWLMHGCPGD